MYYMYEQPTKSIKIVNSSQLQGTERVRLLDENKQIKQLHLESSDFISFSFFFFRKTHLYCQLLEV